MPHVNQIALIEAAERWIEQAHRLPADEGAYRLGRRIRQIEQNIQILGADADETPVELAGLSVFDLQAAQAKLLIEQRVLMRPSVSEVAA
jgi:hypothetical protein